MTEENKQSSNSTRRQFLTSTAVASVISLSGCTSLLNNDDEQSYEDLPDPTYDEVEETPPDDDNNSDDPNPDEELTQLEQTKQTFLKDYKETRDNLERTIDLIDSTIDNFEDRNFDSAKSNLTTSALALQSARDTFTRNDMQEMASTLNEEIDTKLDFDTLRADLQNTISAAQTTIDTLHDADYQRETGQDQEYYDTLRDARIEQEEVKFLLPETVEELYNNYDF